MEFYTKFQCLHNNPYLQLLVWQYTSQTVSAIFCSAFFFVRDIYYKHFKPIANPRARLVSFCRNQNRVRNKYRRRILSWKKKSKKEEYNSHSRVITSQAPRVP